MKKELNIPVKTGFCKNCFKKRRSGSAYCGTCQGKKKERFYIDEQDNFPLIKEAKKKFSVDANTVFTYGDTCYSDNELSYDLIVHEVTHFLQQRKYKGGKKGWWDRYFKDENFRLKQEIEAYSEQYKCIKTNNIADAPRILDIIATILSGDLYGNLVSFEKAKKLITGEKEKK